MNLSSFIGNNGVETGRSQSDSERQQALQHIQRFTNLRFWVFQLRLATDDAHNVTRNPKSGGIEVQITGGFEMRLTGEFDANTQRDAVFIFCCRSLHL